MNAPLLVRGNLPADLTSFVGRRAELSDVKQQLGGSRLVTLTGIGGVGKTRLALRVAGQLDRVFSDGVWVIELATLRDPSLVLQRVSVSMGLRDDARSWSVALLTEHLAHRRTLLILDNCEHVLDACAVLVESLLRAVPELRVLATSRQPLGVAGERVVTVPPLSVPDNDLRPSSLEGLSRYDAVTLFVERARDLAPSFEVTADNMAAVARLVQRLDGIPLAVELAAARVRVLSPQQILSRLGGGRQLLTSPGRTSVPHQRSLQALIDWSYDLCGDAEKLLWSRLSVFPRDFDVEAAEQVCGDEQLAVEAVLDALAGLVDKSVLIAEGSARVRYRLPQPLSEYGRAKLAGMGGDGVIRRRHCRYYGRLAERAWQEWFGPAQSEWTSWMQREQVNLLAALEFSLAEPGERRTGLSVLPALSLHWTISGSLQEGRRLIDRALAVEQGPTHGRALLLCFSAWLALNQNDLAATEVAAREGLELSRGSGDPRTFGRACSLLAEVCLLRGQPVAAQPLYEQALQAAGMRGQVASVALRGLAAVAAWAGDRGLQESLLSRCVALCEDNGETWELAETLWARSLLSWEQGDRRQATKFACQSLTFRAAFPERTGMAECLEILAWISAAESRFERAGVLLAAADTLWRSVGAVLSADLTQFHLDCEARVRRALGERGFTAATGTGAGWTLNDLVQYALGNRLPTTTTTVTTSTSALTKREQQIAELVSTGLSNREIAARMVISQRTAEGHVEHILVKLGLTSRTQIAAWVAERRAEGGEDLGT
jgi:predicted ATPase/DNA-binding CsgD family transcriptional regulator